MFQAKVGGKFAVPCVLDSDIDTHANSLKEVLLATVEGVIGRQKTKIQPWVTNDVLDLCDQREQLKQKCTSTVAGLENRKVNGQIRRKMKAAKEEWIGEQWKSIERGMMLGTMPSMLSPRANSVSQQSSETAAETS